MAFFKTLSEEECEPGPIVEFRTSVNDGDFHIGARNPKGDWVSLGFIHSDTGKLNLMTLTPTEQIDGLTFEDGQLAIG